MLAAGHEMLIVSNVVVAHDGGAILYGAASEVVHVRPPDQPEQPRLLHARTRKLCDVAGSSDPNVSLDAVPSVVWSLLVARCVWYWLIVRPLSSGATQLNEMLVDVSVPHVGMAGVFGAESAVVHDVDPE